MRCGIDRLAGIITDKYNLDLFDDALFLFCGLKKDRFKALYWDTDGFILLYKRIENGAPTRFNSSLSGFDDALFLFCGLKKDRFKALYWDTDGFILLYKRIENGAPTRFNSSLSGEGNLQWPRNQEEVKKLTSQELRWLLEGLSIQQPKAIKPAHKGCIN